MKNVEEHGVQVSRFSNCVKNGAIHRDREEKDEKYIKDKGGNEINCGYLWL